MSTFYDRYLAPGDVRSARLAAERRAEEEAALLALEQARRQREQQQVQRIGPNARRRRQDGLLYGGALFTLLSLFVTRRALARKKAPFPKPFSPTAPTPAISRGDGALDATEALGLATLNVFSLGMLAAGAVAKYLDIADVEDLRVYVRRNAGFDVYGGDAKADQEMEDWVRDLLSKKEVDGGFGGKIAEKLRELEEMEAKKVEGGAKK